jgi:hypothetical protein
MAQVFATATCFLCGGTKVVYNSAIGQHRPADFSRYELIHLLAANQLTAAQCPQCNGTGKLQLLVSG